MNNYSVKATILVDNRINDGLTAEHGFSLWIETSGRHILFDTGQGAAIENNADKLGVNLGLTDTMVLSHGHYDHTGGIPIVLRRSLHIDVYCHPGAVSPRYALRQGGCHPIQMPQASMAALDRLSLKNLHWIEGPLMLDETIGITGPIPRETAFEDTGGPFYLDPEGKRVDLIDDDLALWMKTESGLVVFAGCSHAGIINTLNFVQRLNSGARIRAVIGGFHLLEARQERLEQTIAALREFAPDILVPCHCTGEKIIDLLCRSIGPQVKPGAAGMVFHF